MRYHSTLESNHSNIGEENLNTTSLKFQVKPAMLLERNYTNTVYTIHLKRSHEKCK